VQTFKKNALKFHTIWDGTELQDCFDSWAHKEHKLIHLPSLICWTIWLERNKTIFENGSPSTSVAAYKALGIFNSWKEAHTKKIRIPHIKKGPDLDDTPTGWFDGATLSNGSQSGAGGLIKILPNSFYKWTFNCGPGTNTRAELLGAWATLFLASRLHIVALQVLGDSRIVIDWLSNKGDLQAISLTAWKDKIRHLQPTFNNLSFKHIYREHNKSADHLSKTTLQKKEGILSYNLWIDDMRALPSF
jgi:ribonuclease HI